MADKYPCGRNLELLPLDEWDFFFDIDEAVGTVEYNGHVPFWICGEQDEFDPQDVALCNRCKRALGIEW